MADSSALYKEFSLLVAIGRDAETARNVFLAQHDSFYQDLVTGKLNYPTRDNLPTVDANLRQALMDKYQSKHIPRVDPMSRPYSGIIGQRPAPATQVRAVATA